MPMARSIDSDYIDLSLMGGFDMGIDLDGFEENVKKFMELPIKYLDSVHDKAVELIEDVHAMLWPPIPDGGVPNKLHETFEGPSNSNIIAGSSPASVETTLVRSIAKVSTPPSLITMESGFTDCIGTDAYEAEAVLTKSPEDTSSQGHTDANDLCLLPEGTTTTERYDSTTSEEIILWNPEISAKPLRLPEPTSIGKDDYVPHVLDTDNVTEQVGLDCSSHSDTLVESSVFCGAIPLENSSANYEELVLQSANDPVEATGHGNSNMHPDGRIKCVAKHHRNDQDDMENDKFEESYVHLRQNTSFKKMIIRNLSSKLRWSKQQTFVQHPEPARSQDRENLGYQVVSSSDDLDEDWEVVL